MSSSTPLVFSQLFLPQPLPATQVATFLIRLASDRNGQPVVFETRADEHGIRHLIGCDATYVHQLRGLLTNLIPGTIVTGLDGYRRPTMIAAGHVIARPYGVPLAVDAPEQIIRTVYAALNRRFHPGEAACVQLVLGKGSGPRMTAPKIPDPTTSVWHTLLHGQPHASRELRTRIRDHNAEHSFAAVLRVGVTGSTQERRHRLALALISGIATAQSAGTTLKLVREDANRINMAPLTPHGVRRVSVPEALALSAWPIGNESMPGMPPAHPKLLRADASVYTGERSFATSSVPGDTRRLGLAPADFQYHGYVLGPTGVGKSHLLQLLAVGHISGGNGLLVLDPKAQMHEYLLARIPKDRWADVYVIDGTDERPLGFNPLDATGRDPDVVADSVLAVFAHVFQNGWGPRTEDIFSASLRTLTRSGTPEQPHTLIDLPRLWTDTAFRRSVIATVQGDAALAGFWAWYEALKPTAQANVIAAPMNKLRQVLLRPAAVKILGQPRPTLRLRDVFRERKIVLLPLNEGLIGPLTTELIGSLAIAEAWQAVQERAAEKDHAAHPGLVIVDEADRFMNLPISLVDALARSRSLSVSWWLATQYWDQLPKAMKAAVKTNARTKAIFRLESDEDARTIAKLAPQLEPEDFMALGKYQIYVRLVADGISTDWALAKTLPPTEEIADPDEVLQFSRELHLPEPALPKRDPDDVSTPPPSPPGAEALAPAAGRIGQIGRVRRHS